MNRTRARRQKGKEKEGNREERKKGNEGEGDRRENESAPWHECDRARGRRKIHDRDAIVT